MNIKLSPDTLKLFTFAMQFTQSHFMAMPKCDQIDRLVKDFHQAETEIFNILYKEEN